MANVHTPRSIPEKSLPVEVYALWGPGWNWPPPRPRWTPLTLSPARRAPGGSRWSGCWCTSSLGHPSFPISRGNRASAFSSAAPAALSRPQTFLPSPAAGAERSIRDRRELPRGGGAAPAPPGPSQSRAAPRSARPVASAAAAVARSSPRCRAGGGDRAPLAAGRAARRYAAPRSSGAAPPPEKSTLSDRLLRSHWNDLTGIFFFFLNFSPSFSSWVGGGGERSVASPPQLYLCMNLDPMHGRGASTAPPQGHKARRLPPVLPPAPGSHTSSVPQYLHKKWAPWMKCAQASHPRGFYQKAGGSPSFLCMSKRAGVCHI